MIFIMGTSVTVSTRPMPPGRSAVTGGGGVVAEISRDLQKKKSGLEDIQRELKKLNARASSGAMHSAKEWQMTGMHCQMLSL